MYPVLPWVQQATTTLYEVNRAASALSIALASGEGVILFGPPGNGKTELVKLTLDAMRLAETPARQWSKTMTSASCVDDLVGPLDIGPIVEAKGGPYNQVRTEEGVLPAHVAWLREGLSAPPTTLACLRDIMESRVFANGIQQVPSETLVYILDTNIDPRELTMMGDEFRALTERFPIQVMVSLTPTPENLLRAYNTSATPRNTVVGPGLPELQDLQERARRMPLPDVLLGQAAELMAQAAGSHGVELNPRIFQKGARMMQASAAIRGAEAVTQDDFIALSFVPGGSVLEKDMGDLVARSQAAASARARISRCASLEARLDTLAGSLKDSYIVKRQLHRLYGGLLRTTRSLRLIPDAFVAEKEALAARLSEKIQRVEENAESLLSLTPANEALYVEIRELKE